MSDELAEERAKAAELLDALRELVDWQNGCPLPSPKWEEGYGNAIEKACTVLAKYEDSQ